MTRVSKKRVFFVFAVPNYSEQPYLSSSRLQRWRVPLGFVLASLFILLANPRPLTLGMGAAVAFVGLAIRAWASGHIRKNVVLATTGPYAYTRNPLYLGSFFLGLGFTIAAGRWELAALFGALFLGIYLPVMRVEANTLDADFGDCYANYARAVPLFFPRFTRYRDVKAPEGRFDRELYLKYREYRASLGFVIAWAVLFVKAYYFK